MEKASPSGARCSAFARTLARSGFDATLSGILPRMSADPLAALAAALGRRPPESLATLPAETLEQITGAVHAARAAQATALERSLEGALRLAPLPVRGLMRRMLT